MRLIIKSVPKNIAQIERYLGELFSQYDINTDLYPDMLISLTEAVNNAIIHGNELDKRKEVAIKSDVQSDLIRFKVSDEGEGFDPEILPDPCCDENIALIGGRGVMLMRALSSDVFFTNGRHRRTRLQAPMITFESHAGFPEKHYNSDQLTNWLIACAGHYEHHITRLSFVFCDEATMHNYNRQYLDHDYYTDILTFPDGHQSHSINGDILINVDRLLDNANTYDQSPDQELLRLLAHGLLHLCGFRDDEEHEKKKMREAEEVCIGLMIGNNHVV